MLGGNVTTLEEEFDEETETCVFSGIQIRSSKPSLTASYSILKVARALDIGETAVRRWVTQLQEEHNGGTPDSKALTLGQQKIQELETNAQYNQL